jgi:hypothetical protein
VYIKFSVQPIHQPYIGENDQHKKVDSALLRKPEAELKAAKSDVVQLVYKQYTEEVGYRKPYSKQRKQDPDVALPVLLHSVSVIFHFVEG